MMCKDVFSLPPNPFFTIGRFPDSPAVPSQSRRAEQRHGHAGANRTPGCRDLTMDSEIEMVVILSHFWGLNMIEHDLTCN